MSAVFLLLEKVAFRHHIFVVLHATLLDCPKEPPTNCFLALTDLFSEFIQILQNFADRINILSLLYEFRTLALKSSKPASLLKQYLGHVWWFEDYIIHVKYHILSLAFVSSLEQRETGNVCNIPSMRELLLSTSICCFACKIPICPFEGIPNYFCLFLGVLKC